jgi:beta-mannanase
MRRIIIILGIIILLPLVISIDARPRRVRRTSVSTATTQPVALGAYIAHAPFKPSEIDTFATLVGKMPAVVMWYQDWVHSKQFRTDLLEEVLDRGATPMVTWEPWNSTGDAHQSQFALRTIIAGRHDSYIRSWARAAARYGQPFYLRFAHEMNGDWYPWAAGVNGNTSEEYIAAWRHVVDIFRAEGASNVRWVWSPNVVYRGSTPFDEVYPGDGYVDWIGLDGYNIGASRANGRWRSVADIFEVSYDVIAEMTSKPMLIAETASAEQGGEKAIWIKEGMLEDIPLLFPRVRAVIWFNENKESDWRVDTSPTTLAAYKQVVTSAQYTGRLP